MYLRKRGKVATGPMQFTVKVKDVMEENVVSVDRTTTVAEAINTMLQNQVWSLVVKEEGLASGVVTDRDLIRRCFSKGLDAKRLTVGEIMSSPVIQVDAEAPIGQAMDKLVKEKVRRLFVIKDGVVVGRVSQTSLLKVAIDVITAMTSAL